MENRQKPASSFVEKLAALVSHQSDECAVCSARVDYLTQLDGKVYAQPCNCLLWHGNLPATWWNYQAKIVDIKHGDTVRVMAADENNGRLATIISPPPGAVRIPEDCVWIEFRDHPKGAHYRLYYSRVDLVATKSLKR